MKFFPVIYLCMLACMALSVQAESLSEKQIVTFLGAGYSSAEVQAQVKKQGYSGAVDVETVQRLRKAGADIDLITLLTSRAGDAPAAEPAKQNIESVSPSPPVSSSSATQAGDKLTNSLGMTLVSVPGTKILMGTTEVTVDQYKAAGLGYQAPKFPQAGNHPAVNISWNDAKAYCAWLSKKEGKKYRLTTDREWSCAVGIGNLESAGGSPESKSGKLADVYPWGNGKPPKGAGNYMGQEWKSTAEGISYLNSVGWTDDNLVHDYNDGVLFTAPVGSYAPNSLGIYDLGGNAWEWCEDKYAESKPWRVLRGGAWGSGDAGLLSSFRSYSRDPEVRNEDAGFRVVCEVD